MMNRKPVAPTRLVNALLDTVNRFINVAFKAVPMRVGIDGFTTSEFTKLLSLDTVVGVNIALVRLARLFVWMAVGLALLARRAVAR